MGTRGTGFQPSRHALTDARALQPAVQHRRHVVNAAVDARDGDLVERVREVAKGRAGAPMSTNGGVRIRQRRPGSVAGWTQSSLTVTIPASTPPQQGAAVSSLKEVGLCALVAATACAGRAPSPGASDERESRPQTSARRQRDVITKEELSDPAIRAQSVFEVVKLLRPHFLNDRGSHSIPYSGSGGSEGDKARAAVDPGTGRVHVSIDNGAIRSLDELRSLHANGVVEIRFLSPAAAMQKFGGAAREGPVILVLTMM